MDKSIMNRLQALEDKTPQDLVIYAITTSGEETTARVKDVLTEDGELKEGFTEVGLSPTGLVVSGNSLKDVKRILNYFDREVEKTVGKAPEI